MAAAISEQRLAMFACPFEPHNLSHLAKAMTKRPANLAMIAGLLLSTAAMCAQPLRTDAGNGALEVALRCERETSSIAERNGCIAKRAQRESPQQLVAHGWTLLDGGGTTTLTRDDRMTQALTAFRVAAKAGYPPAYQAMAVALSHSDPALSEMWRQVAATSGLSEEASTYLKRLSPRPELAASMRLIECHPAAYRERRLVRSTDSDAVLMAGISSSLTTLRSRGAAEADRLAQGFGECNKSSSYYMQSLNDQEIEGARTVVRDMLKRVRRDVAKFPELGLLAWPAYDTLEP